MHLDALVVAVGGAARVRDGAVLAGGGGEHHARRCRNRRASPIFGSTSTEACADDGGDLFAQQEAGHVEIVDRHVAEDAAGAGDVVDRRRAGIAAEVMVTISTSPMVPASMAARTAPKCGSKRRLKPTISVALVSRTTLRQALTRSRLEVDRLFAEDRLAGAGEGLDQVGMGVGRGADHHGVDVLRREDLLDAADGAAVLVGNRLRGGGKGIGHSDEFCIGVAGDGLGVDLADAAGAQKSESDSHGILVGCSIPGRPRRHSGRSRSPRRSSHRNRGRAGSWPAPRRGQA